jgi:outer membrane protein assembly factor BamB
MAFLTPSHYRPASLLVWPVLCTVAFAIVCLAATAAVAQQGGNAFGGEALNALTDDSSREEPSVFLITDRGRERLLDRARRLAADERWSDAAAVCDEILADDRDAFVEAATRGGTAGSVRSQAADMVASFPRPGREAYQLLFRARAEKRLAEAIAADDHEAIVAVARRWFGTPAGRQAAVITAIVALEEGQPLVAATWLDRVKASDDAAAFEPSLAVMRSMVQKPGGDRPATHQNSSGRNWLQARGGPSRNTLVQATKPLLVPRYRVPLVRHPDEARRLERQRQAAADAGGPVIPAGTVLAAGEFLVVHTPLGILAVNFETGKRVWLESGVATAEPDEGGGNAGGSSGRLFDDATSGTLASDGRLVFAVEPPPEALAATEPMMGGFPFHGRNDQTASWNGENTLSAYDINTGAVRWRIPSPSPADDEKEDEEQSESTVWFLGPPLVAESDIYILAEEGGEARLECRAAEDGRVRWQQPLVSYDEHETIMNPEARGRRLAGLTPAFADGVLVCPLGAGCVVALDTATRSLLWAHHYARAAAGEDRQGRGVVRPLGEPCPVIADGLVLLAPYDATGLLCLHARDGKPAWPAPKRGRLRVAGVVANRAIVVGDASVEALDMATGNRVWKLPLADVGRPSGRGVLTPTSLLLPLDTPEVVEIGLADGRIKGHAPARGGGVPGNLVAHRGEIISRGVDSLDVFHQEAALESRIETAQSKDPGSPWAAYWGGQIAIERGEVAQGLELIRKALTSPTLRLPPDDLSDTVVRALHRDFAAAAAWQESRGSAWITPSVSRMLMDGFLSAGDLPRAWASGRQLIDAPGLAGESGVRDPADPWLVITPNRWIRGRLTRLIAFADEPLRREIDEACRGMVASALAAPESPRQQLLIDTLAERLGSLPAAEPLHQRRVPEARGSESRQTVVRGALAALALGAPVASPDPMLAAIDSAWPLGRVTSSRGARSTREGDLARTHPLPLPLAGAGLPGTRAVQAMLDGGQRKLVVTDRFGMPIGAPVPVEGVGQELLMPWANRTSAVEAAVVGRALFVRTRKELVAYDMEAAPGRGRGLWRRADYAAAGDPTGDARWPGGVGGRVARDGGVPLGMRITEPEESPRGDGRGLVALPEFVLVPGPRSLALLDPASGHLLWERQRLAPGLEWIVDRDVLCGLTVDGHGSIVLAADDGRLLHTFDVPHRRQRLVSHGRNVVTIRSIDDLPGRFTARHVRLDVVDPAARTIRPLGEFSGEARAAEAGPGRLAVMEPGGELTVIDIDTASVVFQVTLPDAPRRFARLFVQPCQDRYLVFAGSPDEGNETIDISPLQQLMLSSPAAAAMSGRLWAIDRADGQSLWPVPAIIERHCLHTSQPTDLPVLTFCRLIRGRGERDPTWLSLLVLDKRTGHAVLDDDRIAIHAHSFLGCDVSGAPDDHTITIAEHGGGPTKVVLRFSGDPIPPQPPYRGGGRHAASKRLGSLKGMGTAREPVDADSGAIDGILQFFNPEAAE